MTWWRIQFFLYGELAQLRLDSAMLRNRLLGLIGINQPTTIVFMALSAMVVAVFVGVWMLASAVRPLRTVIPGGHSSRGGGARATCPHGVPIGTAKRNTCQACALETGAAAEIDQRLRAERARKRQYEQAAAQMQAHEAERLQRVIVLSNAELGHLPYRRFTEEITEMFRRLGYAVSPIETETAFLLQRKQQTFLLQCGEAGPVDAQTLETFLSAMLRQNAAIGYFINLAGFTQAAMQFGPAAGIELIDGPTLAALMLRSKPYANKDDSYNALCPRCGTTHGFHLRAPAETRCPCGAMVRPNLSLDESLGAAAA